MPSARAVAAPVPPVAQFLSGEVGQALPVSLLSLTWGAPATPNADPRGATTGNVLGPPFRQKKML